jgi:hypothetical protein
MRLDECDVHLLSNIITTTDLSLITNHSRGDFLSHSRTTRHVTSPGAALQNQRSGISASFSRCQLFGTLGNRSMRWMQRTFKVHPYVPGHTVWRDTLSSGRLDCPQRACI